MAVSTRQSQPETPATSAGIIQFRNVCKNYGEAKVLDDICLEIQPGEFVTVIGSSGSGKTTMLKMVNGLNRPDSGAVLLWGEDMAGADLIRLRRKIGYVIQGSGLFPHLDVGRNITYVPWLRGRQEGRQAEKSLPRLLDAGRPGGGSGRPFSVRAVRRPAAAGGHCQGSGRPAGRRQPGGIAAALGGNIFNKIRLARFVPVHF